MKKKKVIIIGGGAAGFFCAAQLHHPYLETVILEKNNKVLSKVKISGGGRCNVTNATHDEISDFTINGYPRGKNLLKKTLHRFSFKNTLEWFASKGVSLHKESDGRVFPITNDSQTIIDCLLTECQKNNIDIQLHTQVLEIIKRENQFAVQTNKGEHIADYVVIATGGYPKLEQYNWLKNLDLEIVPPVPSLFTFNLPQHPITQLMGVAASNISVKIIGEKFKTQGPLLITHWGLSGPAILRASAWGAEILSKKNWDFIIHINWIEPFNDETMKEFILDYKSISAQKLMANKNPFALPNRLWDYLLKSCDISLDTKWRDISNKSTNKLINALLRFECHVSGKTTFKEEFVTAGGIDLKEINSQTMELKKHQNIFAIGEAINVDGITGGYNFQNAWTSGYIAAKEILKNI